jgi:hypothetical protein
MAKLSILLCLVVTLFSCKERSDEKLVVIRDNGRVTSEFFVVNGMKNGTEKTYHGNGKVRYIRQYVNDLLEGEEREFSDAGVLISRVNYVGGRPHGKFRLYTQKGNLLREGQFEDGKLHGIIHGFFPEDSTRIESIEYVVNDGNMELTYFLKTFNLEGKLISEERSLCVDRISSQKNEVTGRVTFCGDAVFESLVLITGSFDASFKNTAGQADTIQFIKNTAEFTIPRKWLVDSCVRGRVVGSRKRSETGDTVVVRRSHFLFEECLE